LLDGTDERANPKVAPKPLEIANSERAAAKLLDRVNGAADWIRIERDEANRLPRYNRFRQHRDAVARHVHLVSGAEQCRVAREIAIDHGKRAERRARCGR